MHCIRTEEVISAPGGLQEVPRFLPNRKFARLQLLPVMDIENNKQREATCPRAAQPSPCHVQRGNSQRHKVKEVTYTACDRVPRVGSAAQRGPKTFP